MLDSNTARPDLVWLAGQPWSQDGGTHRAMATAISAYARILWVDPPASPVSRHRRQSGVTPQLTAVTDSISRLTAVVLPGFTRPGVRLTTPALMRTQVRWAIRRLGLRPSAVVMLYLGGLLGGWGRNVTSIMYGTDDYVAGAELMRVSVGHLRRRESQALSNADVVVAVSPDLASRWAAMGADPVVIPNGCWPVADASARPAARESGLARPVAGIIGRLSDRIDMGVLEAIADAGQSLLIMGPRDPRWAPERFNALTTRPSVRYTGPVPNADVPGWLAGVDVSVTPYRDTPFNRASFPLKTLESLGLGVPVVASGLPAVRWLRANLESAVPADVADQVLVIADTGPDYVRAIDALAASGAGSVDARVAFAHRHSWSSRARIFAMAVGLISEPPEIIGGPNEVDVSVFDTEPQT